MSDEPRKIFLGTFADGMPTHLYIPKDALKPAEIAFDRERERREKEIAQVKAQSLRDARNRSKLKRALTALGFRSGRRGR